MTEPRPDLFIMVWPFYDAPAEYRELSPHGGDEDWLAFIPEGIDPESVMWCDPMLNGPFGRSSISEHPVLGGLVRIGVHA